VRFLFRQQFHCQALFSQFDLIIFDCPPRLTTSAVNALTCSDYVLIPTKLDQDSINSVPRTIKWLDQLAGLVCAQLVGVVANDVSLRTGKLTAADQNSYNYLAEVVAQCRAGNRGFVFEATIKSDSRIPPVTRGVVACVDDEARGLFLPFVRELRRKISL
jgi:cellulose biosynthesis protein BcsQ